jgi:hypothetical protein
MRILRRVGRKVTIELIDDLDGTEAGETVAFELDGRSYEIDLSASNADVFRRRMSTYIDQSRADRCVS